MNIGATQFDRRFRRQRNRPISTSYKFGSGGSNTLAIWLALIGLVLPSPQMQFFLAGAKLTPGRLCIILLLLPALGALLRKGRHFLAADFFACAVGIWMIGANISTSGFDSLSSAAAECIEFLGGYLVARGLIFGPAAVGTFIRALKILTVVIVALAFVDRIFNEYVTLKIVASIFHSSAPGMLLRNGVLRATSTLDHPILLGTYCALVPAAILYYERSIAQRVFFCGLCIAGCYLSQSSAAILGFLIVISAYFYNQTMRRFGFKWRWRALWLAVAGMVVVLFIISDHPFESLIYHLTLDRGTGYYRLMIWSAATPKIAQAPFTGYAFQVLNNEILDHTVDSAWLVYSLRFGLPMIAFVFLTNIAALWPVRSPQKDQATRAFLEEMCPAFSTILVVIMLTGFTVHYWNYMWIFWGLCIGLRASLRELSLQRGKYERGVLSFRSTRNPAALAARG